MNTRKVENDGRCKVDPEYHQRLRTDTDLFDREAALLGEQPIGEGEPPLVLGFCRGCGTTVTRKP